MFAKIKSFLHSSKTTKVIDGFLDRELTVRTTKNLIVRNCPNLQDLYIYEKKQSVTIINCPLLASCYCVDNGLVSLIARDLPSMVRLNCSCNSLVTINSIEVPSLKALDIDRNCLKDVDLSNFPNLERFFCSTNHLTLLNVEGHPSLEFLSVPYNFLEEISVRNTRLEYLTLSHNLITQLDLTETPLLRDIELRRNRLMALPLGIRQLNLRELSIEANPIRFTREEELWLQEVFQGRRQRNQLFYEDSQNVHDSGVQKGLISLIRKMKATCKRNYGWVKEIPTLQKFCMDQEILSSCDIKLEDMCCLVWDLVERLEGERRETLVSLIREEVNRFRGICLTGRITNLANVLGSVFDEYKLEVPIPLSEISVEVFKLPLEQREEEFRKRTQGREENLEPWIEALLNT